MTTAVEHGRIILSAIIPARRDLLDRALRHLTPDHFPDPTLANLFIMLERYSEVTGAILTRDALIDLLAPVRSDAGKVALYQETYDLLATTPTEEAAFRWSLEQIRELAASRATASALSNGMDILQHGVETDNGDQLRGHADARTATMARFAEIDRDLSMQEAPEGDMRVEGDDMLTDYASRRAARITGRSVGIEFGIAPLDGKINGLQPGELILLAGWTADGKSSLTIQMAWHAAVRQGRNVVYFTTETLRHQVRRRLLARHSCLDYFAIKESERLCGLNSRDIKSGTLTVAQEEQFQAVVADFTRNPGYGRCYIVQVPHRATVAYLEAKLVRIQRMFPVDLIIMDYLTLLRPERGRTVLREELGQILKESKQIATTFNDGQGVPFVSPWQINRVAKAEVDGNQRNQSYTAAALAETAEASNSADLIISLLKLGMPGERVCPAKLQIIKNRDGETASAIDVQVDYATSRFFVDSASPPIDSVDVFSL